MARRTFIQRLVYTILVLFFGPDVLSKLDIEQTEKVVDQLDERVRSMSRDDIIQAYMDLISEQIAFSFDEVFLMSVEEALEQEEPLWLDTEG